MAQANKFSVDGTVNTAALELYVDDVLVTTYTWAGGTFVLSERLTDVTVTRSGLVTNVADIETWQRMVDTYCAVTYSFDPHDLRVNDHANTTRYRLEFGAVMAIDCTITKASGDTEFKARSEVTATPEEFRRFIRCLKMMLGQPIEGWIK